MIFSVNYQLLKSREVSSPASEVNKKNLKKNSHGKTSKVAGKKVNSASSGSESDEEEEDEDEQEEEEEEVKPQKKITQKGRLRTLKGLKNEKYLKKRWRCLARKESTQNQLRTIILMKKTMGQSLMAALSLLPQRQ